MPKLSNRRGRRKGRLDEHSQQLPAVLYGPLEWLLGRWFDGVRLGAGHAGTLARAAAGPVVYVTRHPGFLETLAGRVRLRRLGLPHPTLTPGQRFRLLQPVGRWASILAAALDCWLRLRRRPDPAADGHFVRRLGAGETMWLPLVAPRDVFSRPRPDKRDPLAMLIEARGAAAGPVTAVPVLFFYPSWPAVLRRGRLAAFFAPNRPPGRLRRAFYLLFRPSRVFVEVGIPLTIDAYLDRRAVAALAPAARELALRRELLERIADLEQSVAGPVPQTPLAAEHAILTSEALQAYLLRSARRRNLPLYRAQREAAVYLREIAARPSTLITGIGMRLAGRIVRQMFDGLRIDHDRLRQVREAAIRGPVVFVPCHRSHMDTLLLGLVLHRHNISLPLVFAGANLAFWPIGPLARRMGAFFVRRTFKGKILYVKVMEAYVRWLLGERYNVLVYIEGTRSRSGKLLPPQLGMLSLLVGAVRQEDCREISFVPVHIGYDRVPEEKAYLEEARGQVKAPESARQLLRLGGVLRRRYGRIYLQFEAPVSLEEVAAGESTPLAAMNSRQVNCLSRRLGERIMSAIDRAAVVTPHGLVAAAALSGGRAVIRAGELAAGVETLMAYAETVGLHLAESLRVDAGAVVRSTLADYARRRWIVPLSDQAEPPAIEAYRVPANRRLALAYYQNTLLGRFLAPALTALLILDQQSFQFSAARLHEGYADLQRLLARDFPPDPGSPPAYRVRKTVKAFIRDAILVPHPSLPDTYRLTVAGLRKLHRFAGLVAAVLESYRVVLEILVRPDSFRHPARDPVRRIRAAALRRLRRGRVRRPEALALPNLANAVAFFAGQGVRGPQDIDRARSYETMLRRYVAILPD